MGGWLVINENHSVRGQVIFKAYHNQVPIFPFSYLLPLYSFKAQSDQIAVFISSPPGPYYFPCLTHLTILF